MPTAVLERQGPVVCFNERFLEFLRPFKIVPRPCNLGQAHEKGKVEKGAIHYIRHNFWPLRSFENLQDLQAQADHWRDHVANVRVHSTTGQRPVVRFDPKAMRPLPELLPDCRDTVVAKVHSDFAIRFDGNTYTVPPWTIGKQLTLKADHHTVTVFHKDQPVATHSRCWQRKQRLELPHHREAARKDQRRQWLSQEVAAFISLGETAKTYLERLATTHQPLKKDVQRLLVLKDQYGIQTLNEAIQHAMAHQACGASYNENILYQKMRPQRNYPPVHLQHEHLNRIRLEEPSLVEYDAFIRKKPHD